MHADFSAAPMLVADIGGTNTRIALARGAALIAESVKRYANADFASLDAVLRHYLADQKPGACQAACVAVAGPVRDGVGEMTNLDWTIDHATLTHATGADQVMILNDLQAQGYALGHLQPGTVAPVLPGQTAQDDATRMVIGIGTGFNAAVVHDTHGTRLVTASESGHITLPARSDREQALARHLAEQHRGFASAEDALSGRGLMRIDRWLAAQDGATDSRDAAQIMEAAAAGEPRADAVLRLACGLLGTICGDLALVHLPFGGINLIGGVARALAPYLRSHGFVESFADKGRFSDFMAQFPVSVVSDDYAALTGCTTYLLTHPV